MTAERLQKVLAAAGIASRRAAETLIAAGRVTIDGRVAELGERVDPDRSRIAVDGVAIGPAAPLVHLACHKPVGVTSTVRDPHAARTVLDLVPTALWPARGRLYPVGRLDRDSEGLLLLTNDGPWADRVLHPRAGHEREYAVALPRALEPGEAALLRTGIELREGTARLLDLRQASRSEARRFATGIEPPAEPGLAWYVGTLGQGWKRQIRRMFASLGIPVVRLIRIRLGTLRLGSLRPGEVRTLRPSEVRELGRPAADAPTPARRRHPGARAG